MMKSQGNRTHEPGALHGQPALKSTGISLLDISHAIDFVYRILDGIDTNLDAADAGRLSTLVELANLSAIVGNLIRAGIVKSSQGRFVANTPHSYPDLIGVGQGCVDLEIKVALEDNNPKGHLVKPGPHMIVRYVLGSADEVYAPKAKRGEIVWIWDVRIGTLNADHFNFSNTDGDSGKTAVVNAAGMKALAIVYCDLRFCPFPVTGPRFRQLKQFFKPE